MQDQFGEGVELAGVQQSVPRLPPGPRGDDAQFLAAEVSRHVVAFGFDLLGLGLGDVLLVEPFRLSRRPGGYRARCGAGGGAGLTAAGGGFAGLGCHGAGLHLSWRGP
jgi:hypothetical protein